MGGDFQHVSCSMETACVHAVTLFTLGNKGLLLTAGYILCPYIVTVCYLTCLVVTHVSRQVQHKQIKWQTTPVCEKSA